MKSKHIILLLVCTLVVAVSALIAGGAFWWRQQRHADADVPHKASASAPAPTPDSYNYKYISLDKVVVMLRGKAGEPASHYLAIDLVFKTREEQERKVKEHLPLLRSIAVRSLSSFTLEKAGVMSIDQLTSEVNAAFNESYKREQREKPFAEAMISKLIIE
ncbi:MAG: flagellar basal body-associated protein FliL [Acidobacteriota bacterium]